MHCHIGPLISTCPRNDTAKNSPLPSFVQPFTAAQALKNALKSSHEDVHLYMTGLITWLVPVWRVSVELFGKGESK